MQYQLVSKVDGQLISETFAPETDILAAFEIRGHNFTGTTPIIRYESSDANDQLSR